MKVLYTAQATATGEGRNGHGRTSDGLLDVVFASPKEMGGAGGVTNPEQLFALGYAACFHQALKVIGRREKVDVDGSTVEAEVGIGPNDGGGFQLQVALTATLPSVDQEAAERIVAAAHQVCPYSNATRGNIDVAVTAVGG
ncbi:MAG TPA: organic hydroperoxide resistance protein [Pseudonocardia sp.]|nr:organic hydroperoxide resistance protein [Pseudonocardia sp.]